MIYQDKTKEELIAELQELQQENKTLKESYEKDISHCILVEEALRESEEKYRILFKDSPDAYLIHMDGVFVDCNRKAEEMLRGKLSQIIGLTPKDISPESQPNGEFSSIAAEERINEALLSGTKTFEWLHRRFDETEFYVEVSITPIVLGGKPALFTTWRDISERKKTEEALVFSNIILHTQQESSIDGILVVDEKGKIISSNQRFVDIWGISDDVMKSKSDERALQSVMEKLTNPEEFITKVKYLYENKDEISRDEISLKDGRTLDRYSAPMLGNDGENYGRVWYFRDITERKEAEKILYESEERYKYLSNQLEAVLDHIPGLVFYKDKKNNFIRVNKYVANAHRLTKEELEGKNLSEIYPKEDAEKYYQDDLLVINSGVAKLNIEESWKTAEGIKWLNSSKIPFIDATGEIIGVIGISMDITGLKQTEEALRESENKYRNLVDNSLVGVFSSKINGDILYVNKAILEIYECDSVANIAAKGTLILYKDQNTRKRMIDLLQQNGRVEGFEAEVLTKNNKQRTILLNAVLEGDVLSGTIIDITKRKEAEAALLASEERMKAVIEQSPVGIVFAKDNVIIEANAAYINMNGYSHRNELIGKQIFDLVPADYKEKLYDYAIRRIKGEPVESTYEIKGLRKDNSQFPALVLANRLNLPDGPLTIGFVTDISDMKYAEQEVLTKNQELQKLIAEKNIFFSIIAHDLRGPLAGFLNLTELMATQLSGMEIDEIQKIATSLYRSAENMYRLLENLLEWTKMQQGLITFNPEVILLMPKVNDGLETIIEQARNKKIDITYDIPDGFKVFADINILKTLIRNFLSNAIKFTPIGGSITISSKYLEDKSAEVTIKDTGIGMNSELLENLFRLDVQTNRKGTEGEPSTGLGLLLCKDFIEKHGGEIWVESDEFKGSTFHFTLPMKEETKNIF